jgi:hypothetical protein
MFKDECATALSGRHLIYLEDHDLPDPNGRIAAKEFSGRAQRLSGLAGSFRIVPAVVLWKDLGRPGEPPHGWDVKDWIAAGGKAEKLAGLADQQGAKDSFEVSNAADLQRQEFEATRFIIPGYVAEGVTLFAGKPKIGKSWLALHASPKSPLPAVVPAWCPIVIAGHGNRSRHLSCRCSSGVGAL